MPPLRLQASTRKRDILDFSGFSFAAEAKVWRWMMSQYARGVTCLCTRSTYGSGCLDKHPLKPSVM